MLLVALLMATVIGMTSAKPIPNANPNAPFMPQGIDDLFF